MRAFIVLFTLVLLAACISLTQGPAGPGGAESVASGPPEDYHSAGGLLSVTLEARPQKVDLGPVSFDGTVFNGHYAGPILRVKPGDLLRITLINHLKEPTNLHFHGLETSPRKNSDNVHIDVMPGDSFVYEVKIPTYQPPGLYWYHAHVHHLAERQVMGGLSGALMVEGFAEQFPPLAGVTERLINLKEMTFDGSPDPVISKTYHDRIQTINGALTTDFPARPGETQLWHVSNNSANLYIDLAVHGHRFRIIGEDGATTTRETEVEVLHVKPAGRFEVLLDAGEPGSYAVVSKRVPTGSGAERSLERVLGTLTVGGPPTRPIATLTQFPPGIDYRAVDVSAHRTVVFTENKDSTAFLIDGRKFDAERVDLRVPLGSVEEWTVRNDTDDIHVFHIHQVHFQVVAVGGVPKAYDGYVDEVYVPERSTATVRIPFTRPEIVGRFMYHCHVLEHEDKGMMAQIEIYDPDAPTVSLPLLQRLAAALLPYDGGLTGRICSTAGL